MLRGVGGALSDGRSYPDVCRVRHMFLRVSRIYHYNGRFGKSQTQPGSGEGYSVITTGYPVTVPGKKVALNSGYRKSMGRRTEIEFEAGLVG